MSDEIINNISDVVRKHLKIICKELTNETKLNYSVKECKMINGLVYFSIQYKHENNNIIGCQTLIEKEIEIKDINISEIKKRLQIMKPKK